MPSLPQANGWGTGGGDPVKEKQTLQEGNSPLNDMSVCTKNKLELQSLSESLQSELRQDSLNFLCWGNTLVTSLVIMSQRTPVSLAKSACIVGKGS